MTDEKAKLAAMATFTQYMQMHRMRKTPERYAIMEKVFDTVSHFSIDSLHTLVESDGYHVSRATVYNTIELLIEAGLVRRHTFGSQAPQYEKIAGLSKHYHLVCTSCGTVREIKDSETDTILNQRRFGKFHPAYIDLNIYGLCSACFRKSRIASKKTAANDKEKSPSTAKKQKRTNKTQS